MLVTGTLSWESRLLCSRAHRRAPCPTEGKPNANAQTVPALNVKASDEAAVRERPSVRCQVVQSGERNQWREHKNAASQRHQKNCSS